MSDTASRAEQEIANYFQVGRNYTTEKYPKSCKDISKQTEATADGLPKWMTLWRVYNWCKSIRQELMAYWKCQYKYLYDSSLSDNQKYADQQGTATKNGGRR